MLTETELDPNGTCEWCEKNVETVAITVAGEQGAVRYCRTCAWRYITSRLKRAGNVKSTKPPAGLVNAEG